MVILSFIGHIYIVCIISINILCVFECHCNSHRNKEWANIDFNGDGIVISTT